MNFKTALLQLKQKLAGGENKVHTYIGMPPKEDRDEFIKATTVRQAAFVKQWKKDKKIGGLGTISVVWKLILLKLRQIPDDLMKTKDQ